MAAPLRLQAVALPVPDLPRVDKFYRWVLAMRTAEGESAGGAQALGWLREDRIVLVDAGAPGAEEAVTLRLPAMTVEGATRWLVERDLAPDRAIVPPADESEARTAWPEASVEVAAHEALHNRLLLSIRRPAEPRIDLHVPLPADVVARRGAIGPFTWKSEDWQGLEIPGLLGVTTGAPDAGAMRAFLARLGFEPLEPDRDTGPFRLGDHQWIVEEREPAGIYGLAVVVPLDRLKDLVRTLERLDAQHRHERNRLVALDPAGRILLVHGLKGG